MTFRRRYFLSHLTFSILVGCLTAAIVYKIWYPGVLAKAIGVSHIFLLLLCIDVTVSPILTLFLAKEGKKGLWFDLMTVIILQFIYCACLWYLAYCGRAPCMANHQYLSCRTGQSDRYGLHQCQRPFCAYTLGQPKMGYGTPGQGQARII